MTETDKLNTYGMSGTYKALSFKQPFAWLIANGYLMVDDRTWSTDYRGTILIHASKGLYDVYYDYLKANTNIPLPAKEHLPFGGVVGVAELVLCSRPGELHATISREYRAQFQGVNNRHFGFLFEQPRALPLIPCAGKLGIFELDMELILSKPSVVQAELF